MPSKMFLRKEESLEMYITCIYSTNVFSI